MDLGISGRRALVAASSQGLGRETARALLEAGCDVVVSGRNAERLDEAVADIGGGTPLVADLSSADAGVALVQQATAAMGGLDILVTNNGGPPPGDFASTDIDAYQGALDMNLLSMLAMVKTAVPPMQDQGWGRVLAITSVSVRQPIPTLILSNTARAGLTAFLKTTALEVAADGVTVNTIQPGLHATARLLGLYDGDAATIGAAVPANAIGDAGDFGRIAAFMCSEHAKFMTGVSVPIDGGAHAGLQ
ncbi:MAG: SDR family oxidoreductase [Actinomycetota bacterium]